MVETFFRPKRSRSRLFVVGEGCEYDTNLLLGDAGIFECSGILDRCHIPHSQGEVFAANHARAIADMVLVSIQNNESLDHVLLDDWMPSDEDKAEVFKLLELAFCKLDSSAIERIGAWKNRPVEKVMS